MPLPTQNIYKLCISIKLNKITPSIDAMFNLSQIYHFKDKK
jgi:hypothetical protein